MPDPRTAQIEPGPNDGDAGDLKVVAREWLAAAPTETHLYVVDLTGGAGTAFRDRARRALITSYPGVVNRDAPRLFLLYDRGEVNVDHEWRYALRDYAGVTFTVLDDPWDTFRVPFRLEHQPQHGVLQGRQRPPNTSSMPCSFSQPSPCVGATKLPSPNSFQA